MQKGMQTTFRWYNSEGKFTIPTSFYTTAAQFAPTFQSGGVEYGILKNSVGTNTRVNSLPQIFVNHWITVEE